LISFSTKIYQRLNVKIIMSDYLVSRAGSVSQLLGEAIIPPGLFLSHTAHQAKELFGMMK
jgi:hypothetical protein